MNTAIKRYPFKATPIGIEAKPLDFLWEKTAQTTEAHRADFYHFIWVEKGEMSVTVDFETLRLNNDEAFLIWPGQVCRQQNTRRAIRL